MDSDMVVPRFHFSLFGWPLAWNAFMYCYGELAMF